MKSLHLLISGRVQGVWYRAWTIEQAHQRGLDGWVRNRSDGRVEAVISGPGPQVDDMLRACHRGPEHARVERVVAIAAEAPTKTGFHKLPTL